MKVGTYETNFKMEFVEYQWHDFDYYPHDHKDLLEVMIITYKKGTFWVGMGTENGFIDTSDPNYGKIGEEGPEAITARKGGGVRVEPGYVIYIPAGVPHAMSETEDGNIWLNTAVPPSWLPGHITQKPNKIYQPKEVKE